MFSGVSGSVYRSNGGADSWLGRKKNRGVTVSASEEQISDPDLPKRRFIIVSSTQ